MINCSCNTTNIAHEGSQEYQQLIDHLTEISINTFNVESLYICKYTGNLWLEYYEHFEQHGGGPATFKKISKSDAEEKFYLTSKFWIKVKEYFGIDAR